MGYGPWASEAAMGEWISGVGASEDPMFFTVEVAGTPVGMVSILNADLAMRRLELGHIWYIPEAHRTGVNTEVTNLLLHEAFETYHCRRVEWKCDSLNAISRHAAVRLGFSYEGTFRNHMIVKGHNRDTAWYGMTDDDWASVSPVLAAWLAADDPKPSLTTMMRDGR
jgi:RimJ/RimL family protein N-acetyltransferase